MNVEQLAKQLDAFDLDARKAALLQLAEVEGQPEHTPPRVNMHCHSFFSFNGYGASPSRIVWRAARDGWHAVGLCDFDVLDGMSELLWAADTLGVRSNVCLETRVFFREYAEHVINSPGEPGVYYFVGAGFVDLPAAGSKAAERLEAMRAQAAARTRAIVERVNAYLGGLQLDFEQDVLPLTPAGNATERHVCTAYYRKSLATFPDQYQGAAFWAKAFAMPAAEVRAKLGKPMDFTDLIRSKLMKSGGAGYMKPDSDTFPALDDVLEMFLDCQAIPVATWLDGTNSGEADIEAQLECLRAKGAAALNIVPDRNWNLADPDERAVKVAKLHECVGIADKLHLPINIGTELNKFGQPWVDDLQAAPLQPVAASFIRGARVMVGHTRLLRFAQFSYVGSAAAAEFGGDLAGKNDFFAAVGALAAPSPATLARLIEGEPEANYSLLRDAAAKGSW